MELFYSLLNVGLHLTFNVNAHLAKEHKQSSSPMQWIAYYYYIITNINIIIPHIKDHGFNKTNKRIFHRMAIVLSIVSIRLSLIVCIVLSFYLSKTSNILLLLKSNITMVAFFILPLTFLEFIFPITFYFLPVLYHNYWVFSSKNFLPYSFFSLFFWFHR